MPSIRNNTSFPRNLQTGSQGNAGGTTPNPPQSPSSTASGASSTATAGPSAQSGFSHSSGQSPNPASSLKRLFPPTAGGTQGVPRHHPYARASQARQSQAALTGANRVQTTLTVATSIQAIPLPQDPRPPTGRYEENMHSHWHGAVNRKGKVIAHSHAQEFLRLSGLNKIGFHLDRIQNWVDYMAFSKWHTQ